MKRPTKIILWIISCAAAVLLAWGIYFYAHYPKVPDLTKVDPITGIKFIATDDFKRLTLSHQQRYAQAALSRLSELEFKDLMMLMMQHNGYMGDVFKNVRSLPEGEKIGGTVLRVFLNDFYRLNKTQRNVALTAVALAQQGEMGQHPERFGLPTADRFKGDMAKFLSNQPPHVQGQMGEFMMDLRNQRDALGLQQPF